MIFEHKNRTHFVLSTLPVDCCHACVVCLQEFQRHIKVVSVVVNLTEILVIMLVFQGFYGISKILSGADFDSAKAWRTICQDYRLNATSWIL